MIKRYHLKSHYVNAIRVDLRTQSGLDELKRFLGFRFIKNLTKEVKDQNGNTSWFNYVTFTNFSKNGIAYDDVAIHGQWLFHKDGDKVFDSLDEERFFALYNEVY